MIIGCPKEIKNNENRVALTPGGTLSLVGRGHTVYVQKGAGDGSGYTDADYAGAGAELLGTIEEVYAKSETIVKVKEPIASEYALIRKGQFLFTYFHFAGSRDLTEAMVKSKAICLAYETVEAPDGSLPLLVPMSEVAGRMAVQEGAKYLESPSGGRGILLGGVPGVMPANVLVLGGGIVGTEAAKMASGLNANVILMDISLVRLRHLAEIMPKNVTLIYSSEYNIRQQLSRVDLIIGAVLIPGAKAPHLITRQMLGEMKKGSVVIDVAVDQGGCIETCHPTTHEDPTYVVDGVIHYCVANMPGAVPFTSTLALTNATFPYLLQIAQKGWKQACADNAGLAKGLNVVEGEITYGPVAEEFKQMS
ncbi:alanine dehydrogenase [Neolewinella antarctica]|uniref:Alanine dehydrogenase n=1 Tax=Neolewinella antarctica TaxID=442734 RepID=A0ABX0X6T6_9BACT|nr:alanine dehydrogenase [Neolewinella antarctica]NJC24588.1 alanine dehydrogenase [Neolewinella antarctica]